MEDVQEELQANKECAEDAAIHVSSTHFVVIELILYVVHTYSSADQNSP